MEETARLEVGATTTTNELVVQLINSSGETGTFKVPNPKSTMPNGAMENFASLATADDSIFEVKGLPVTEVHLTKVTTTKVGLF